MLLFPNCKINIGLNVTEKYPNGYHALETVFYPINWTDILEITEKTNQNTGIKINQSGIKIDGKPENNILFKAYHLLAKIKPLPKLSVNLHKVLPMGAGLGGGSSNAAFLISYLNNGFGLKIEDKELRQIASQLGADCAFFLTNKPVYATGIGNLFNEINLNLNKYHICLVYPNVHSNTKQAYASVNPKKPDYNLKQSIENLPVSEWKNIIRNDFEDSVFKIYPQIAELKQYFYQQNALYAAMSGSGSTVFGIFKNMPGLSLPQEYLTYLQSPHE